MKNSLVCSITFLLICCQCSAEEFDPTKPLGSIKGTITWQGDIPPVTHVNTASAGMRIAVPPPVRKEDLIVSADGKVANILVYVSKGLESLSFQKMKLLPVVLHHRDLRLGPHVLGVMVGQTLLMSQESDYVTNWHGMGNHNTEFNIATQKQGLSHYRPKFISPEMRFVVQSDVFPWERAFICVFDHPFFAVTAEDGTFEIKIPPGEYQVTFWHEKDNKRKAVAPPPQTVTVTANKATEITAIATSNEVKPKPSQ